MNTLHARDPWPCPEPSLSLHLPSGVVLEVPWSQILGVDYDPAARQLTVHASNGRVLRSVPLY